MTLVWRPGYLAEGDPYFSNVSLLLHGNGTNGSTTIVDNSRTPKTVTVAGNAQISTAQSAFTGGSSIAFDGTGDYLTIGRDPAFNFATGDFTIEAWCRFATATDQAILGSIGPTNGGLLIRRLADGTIRIGRAIVAWDLISSALTWSTSSFYHIAVVKSSGTAYIFRDGVSVGSAANAFSYNLAPDVNTVWAVGAAQFSSGSLSPDAFMNGYIDDLRITKGIARYTSNFTPPDAPFPDAQY